MEITLSAGTITTAAAVIAALGGIGAAVYKIIKWVQKRNEDSKEIVAIRGELCLLTYGVLACLKGLSEQGCDGPVTEAIGKIEKHVNEAAHGQYNIKEA